MPFVLSSTLYFWGYLQGEINGILIHRVNPITTTEEGIKPTSGKMTSQPPLPCTPSALGFITASNSKGLETNPLPCKKG